MDTKLARIVQFFASYPIHRHKREPWQVLIATLLSHRTKDEVTHAAADRLFKRFRSIDELATADITEIAELIKPVGFYRVKAVKIKAIAEILKNEYNGEVPCDIDELLKLPGVGRKTANCVIAFGFGQPSLPVDTHVHRISNRLGIVHTSRPEETEAQLKRLIPKEYWIKLNPAMVHFGKSICRPIRPLCETCKLRDVCDYGQQNI